VIGSYLGGEITSTSLKEFEFFLNARLHYKTILGGMTGNWGYIAALEILFLIKEANYSSYFLSFSYRPLTFI